MDCQITVPQSAFRNPHLIRSAIRISSSPRRLLASGCDDHSNDD
jgi:hypothetical protein